MKSLKTLRFFDYLIVCSSPFVVTWFNFMETIKLGPLGWPTFHSRETAWDDLGHNVISHIVVCSDKSGVTSIQFGYVVNGALVMSKTYGSSPVGRSSKIVRLNHGSEFLTGISGEVNRDNITSLTFHTNQSKYEAVQLPSDTKSRFYAKVELHSGILKRCEFGGFFGTYDSTRLNSIGFYVRLDIPNVKTLKDEKI